MDKASIPPGFPGARRKIELKRVVYQKPAQRTAQLDSTRNRPEPDRNQFFCRGNRGKPEIEQLSKTVASSSRAEQRIVATTNELYRNARATNGRGLEKQSLEGERKEEGGIFCSVARRSLVRIAAEEHAGRQAGKGVKVSRFFLRSLLWFEPCREDRSEER